MVKLNKIYTRTGDDGTTGLVDGSRTAKHAARMEAIGAVDEANSAANRPSARASSAKSNSPGFIGGAGRRSWAKAATQPQTAIIV